MSDTTKSLRPLVNRAPCWESEHEPVITFFTDNGHEWGFPFFGLLAAQYTPRDQTLALQWQGAQVRIQGPRTRDFFMAFAKGSATGIKANGEDILSVEVILPPSPPPAASSDKGKKRPDE
jgi:hypothetical protein